MALLPHRFRKSVVKGVMVYGKGFGEIAPKQMGKGKPTMQPGIVLG